MKMNFDLSSTCRVCLLSDSKGISLQQKTDSNKQYTFLEMFIACTHLEVLELDDFPQFICQSCSNDLQIAFDFVDRASASDKFLKDQYLVKNEVEYYYLSDENKIPKEHEVKNEVAYYGPSDENKILQIDHKIKEKWFDLEESSQTEHQVEDNLNQYEDDINSETYEPVKYEAIDPENDNRKQGFDKQFEQFVEVELASESVFLESNGSSTHSNDAGIIASDLDTEKELKPPESQTNFECKVINMTSRKSKKCPESQFVECNICGKTLKQLSIKHHLKRCQNIDRLHLCSSCPKSFAVRCDLKNHMRTHDNERERKYMCSVCGKGFFEKQSLKVHLTRHMGEKKYHCTICPKQFTTKKSRDVHEFTHNRELGRFICKHCDKRFPSKADLTVHERFHTGDYPFQCEFCEKSYAVKSHYNYHLAKHKGITYKCDQCDKEFLNRGSLTAHKFKHNERMPHECSICKKGFASSYKLNRHKSCHKPKEDEAHVK